MRYLLLCVLLSGCVHTAVIDKKRITKVQLDTEYHRVKGLCVGHAEITLLTEQMYFQCGIAFE